MFIEFYKLKYKNNAKLKFKRIKIQKISKISIIKTDIILSLGSACRTAHHLRKNHLRSLSSPLDWIVSGDFRYNL
ncbi:hypothetical protein JG676_00455 [Campylobacter sp. 2018MI35]|nr:hypothetical protein [Campylobacter sp. 2018MI34]